MSDSDRPLQLQADIVARLNGTTGAGNPFIVEGQLYAEKEQKSYSIKYVDNKHIVVEYDLENVPDNWNVEGKIVFNGKSFIANRLDGVAEIKFRQYWKPKLDELCEGMKMLVPAGYVFVGFEYNNEEKEEK
jgi:CRISPR type III-associated protein (TIGR04423 family)